MKQESRPARGRRAAIWVFAVALIATLLLLFRLWNKPNLGSTASLIADCAAKEDGECLASFMTKEETDALGIQENRLAELLTFASRELQLPQSYVLTATEPEAEVVGSGSFVVQAQSKGRLTGFPFQVVYTDDGIKSPDLASAMLIADWRNDVRDVVAATRGEAIFVRILRGFDEDRAHLEKLGVTGLLYRNSRMSLDEFRAYCEEVLARLRSSDSNL